MLFSTFITSLKDRYIDNSAIITKNKAIIPSIIKIRDLSSLAPPSANEINPDNPVP